MNCRHCGTELESGQDICWACGKRLPGTAFQEARDEHDEGQHRASPEPHWQGSHTPPGPSKLRTIGREVAGKSEGTIYIILGLILWGATLGGAIALWVATEEPGGGACVGVAGFLGGLVLLSVGAHEIRKAKHVAWTMEAIERVQASDRERLKCRKCSMLNRPDALFCSACASRIRTPCPGCGRANEISARFCDSCGLGLTHDVG